MSQLFDFVSSAWVNSPLFLQVVMVLIGGWIAANLLRWVTQGLLALFRFDHLADRTGLGEFLRNGQVTMRPAKLLSVFVYWAVILVTLLVASRVLNITVLNAITDRLVKALPNIVAAVFIVTVGLVIVSFLANVLKTIARNTSMTNVRTVVRVFRYIGYSIIILMASDQLGLGKGLLSELFVIAFGALALAFAIAFGLGSVEVARRIMGNLLKMRDREDQNAEKNSQKSNKPE
ncbi:MAG: hypothetical protein HKM06_01910 [Spirochaetales bacterium]|nr:hypothetical protein [Spirochaetales bacterium]